MELEDIIELIKVLHEGQFDWAGNPYWTHPVEVQALLPANSPYSRRAIALLHDVIEDCKKKIAEILGLPEVSSAIAAQFLLDKGFSDHIVKGVGLLTRDKEGITYIQEIRNIAASGHLDAMWVKLCDNTHNTAPERIAKMSEEDRIKSIQMQPRYERSKKILRQGIIDMINSPITYINWRGEIAKRNINPISMRYGTTEWHPKPQWLLLAHDLDKNVEREFAFEGIV